MAQVEGTQIRFTSDSLSFRIYRGEFIEVKKSYTELNFRFYASATAGGHR